MTALLAERHGEVLGFAGRGGEERLRLGRALHAAYQERAAAEDPSFRAEVPLTAELRHAGRRVLLHGRADGLRRAGDGGAVVQELKTRLPGSAPSEEARAAARLQAALYAWLLGRARGEPARAEVLWIEPGAERPRAREPAGLSPAEAEAELRRLLAPLVARREALEARRARERRAAEALRFPHAAPRPGQEALVEAASRALAEGEQLLVEAPAGLGKTIAALLPALRLGLATGRRVVWLTARHTQRSALRRALESLAPALPPGIGVALRARAALCANDRLLCHPAGCRFAAGYARKRGEAGLPDAALGKGALLEPEALLAAGREAEICPFELGLDAAEESPLVVCDWNHALDPERAVGPFAGERGLEGAIVVVDEVHGLVERARAQQSAALEPEVLEAAAREAALGGAPVHEAQAAVCAEAGALVRELAADALPPEGDAAVEQRLPAERLRALTERADSALGAGLAYRAATGGLDGPEAFEALHAALGRLASAAEHSEEAYAPLVERRSGRVRLRVACLDPSRGLRERLGRAHALLGLSATLAPAWLHRELLGLDPARTAHVRVPDPFPPERRRVVIDARLDTRERRRAQAVPRVARRLAALAAAVPGHTLALLPSYAWLEAVAEALPAASGRRLLRQRPGQDEAEREGLAAALAPGEPPSLLLAVAGGALAEGVEFPGGALRAVAVVGPCCPPPEAERALLAERLEERLGAGFEAAYALPGMRRVVQGAGRLLRSEEDRGVIALLGRRFLRAPYRDLLPEAWLGGAEPEALAGDPARAAAALFGAGGSGAPDAPA